MLHIVAKHNIHLPFTVPDDLQNAVLNFALYTEVSSFRNNGTGRRFCNVNTLNFPLTSQVKDFASECYGSFGIPVIEEPMFGNFIGVNQSGGAVHPHTDPRSADGLWHVRINFLLSKPEQGGMPIIDDIEYSITENDCWINLASEWRHQSSEVVGPKPRVVLSLGSFVSEENVKKILER